MTNKHNDFEWEFFGPDLGNVCEICGHRPAKTEPRFLYSACSVHCLTAPIEFQKERIRKRVNGE